MPTDIKRWALVLALLTPGLWSANAIVSRLAPGVIEPYTLALGRWLVAGTVLALLARQDLRIGGHEWLRKPLPYLALGFLGMFVCGALFYKAGRTTQAINMGLIYATSPIFITLASTYALGEKRLSLAQWLNANSFVFSSAQNRSAKKASRTSAALCWRVTASRSAGVGRRASVSR